MRTKEYRLSPFRIISLWSFPVLLVLLILPFAVIGVSLAGKIIALSFLSALLGAFAFLFFNHLPLARNTRLLIGYRQIQFICGDHISPVIPFTDITEIKGFVPPRSLWSSIIRWEIQTPAGRYTVSSLTISQFTFEQYFYNKIQGTTAVFPVIKENEVTPALIGQEA